MTGKELIDATLASSDETKKVCPYFRVGYCKYKKHCKHFHPSENCSERKCRDKNCNKRHRKLCRFGRICIRIESCEFLHEEGNRSTTDTSEKDNKLQILEELINTKDTLILELAEKVELLEASVKSMKEDIEEFRKSKSKSINIIEKVDPIQLDPNKPCERCDKVFTTDRDLRYHKKHEHQEDKSVVKIPIKSQVPATVQIVHPAANTPGKTSVTVIDKEKVSTIPVLQFYLSFLFEISFQRSELCD